MNFVDRTNGMAGFSDILLEGEVVLQLVNALVVRPPVVIAISGVPANNDRLVQIGGVTHNAGGKDPQVIRRILMDRVGATAHA